MANGKEPKTTGEHIIALYGHLTGVKRDLKELREESSNMHNKFERKLFPNLRLRYCGIGIIT